MTPTPRDDPLGPFKDINDWFPDWKPGAIFDVGAHTGQFSRKYGELFPDAKIYAFEPNPSTFEKLRGKSSGNVTPLNFACSSRAGTLRMTNKLCSTGNRVDPDGEIEVKATTVADMMGELQIDRLGFLKVDAEGHDVEVLRGSPLSLIDFVQVETMLNRHDPQGTFYAPVYDYMTSQGFYVFNLYAFTWEWRRGKKREKLFRFSGKSLVIGSNPAPIARRCDTVFINPRLVELS